MFSSQNEQEIESKRREKWQRQKYTDEHRLVCKRAEQPHQHCEQFQKKEKKRRTEATIRTAAESLPQFV